ncbi:MAG: FtsK/SpoIIIE domain-containing protein [Firmicutes bacterium]|nr:FtsK/SpoIIIE domain-containing protein [Bacillota bacterium]
MADKNKRGKDKKQGEKKSSHAEITGIILIIVAFFFVICLFTNLFSEIGGMLIKELMTGLLGFFAYAAFLALGAVGFMLLFKKRLALGKKRTAYIIAGCFLFLCLLQLITSSAHLDLSMGDYISNVYDHAEAKTAGGIFFGIFAFAVKLALSKVGAYIFYSGLLALFLGLLVLDVVRSRKKLPPNKRDYKKNKGGNKGGGSDFQRRGVDAAPLSPVVNNGLYIGRIMPKERKETAESGTFTDIIAGEKKQVPPQRPEAVKKLSDYFATMKGDEAGEEKQRIDAKQVLFGDVEQLGKASADRFLGKTNISHETTRGALSQQTPPQMPSQVIAAPDIRENAAYKKSDEKRMPEVVFAPPPDTLPVFYAGEIIDAAAQSDAKKEESRPKSLPIEGNFVDDDYDFTTEKRKADKFVSGKGGFSPDLPEPNAIKFYSPSEIINCDETAEKAKADKAAEGKGADLYSKKSYEPQNAQSQEAEKTGRDCMELPRGVYFKEEYEPFQPFTETAKEKREPAAEQQKPWRELKPRSEIEARAEEQRRQAEAKQKGWRRDREARQDEKARESEEDEPQYFKNKPFVSLVADPIFDTAEIEFDEEQGGQVSGIGYKTEQGGVRGLASYQVSGIGDGFDEDDNEEEHEKDEYDDETDSYQKDENEKDDEKYLIKGVKKTQLADKYDEKVELDFEEIWDEEERQTQSPLPKTDIASTLLPPSKKPLETWQVGGGGEEDEEDYTGHYIKHKPTPSFTDRAAALDKKIDPKNQINIENYMSQAAANTPPKPRKKRARYIPPPAELLTVRSTAIEDYDEDFQKNAALLEETLKNLKLPAKVIGITRGPAVTRYELEVPPGYTVKKMEGLSADIAYSLASAGGIRIEAPIPGKRAVGVEVPNRVIGTVALRDMIEAQEFTKAAGHLTLCIGKDIAGKPIVCNLENMPHLLVAGSTNSGKSACLHCLIVSMIYKASPAEVRLILIDPKRVEFPAYKGLRHLMINNIINEREHAINVFKWVREEMEERYKLLAKSGTRNLREYNALPNVKSGEIERMPNLVIIVDELSDLMIGGYKKEMEEHILSIAQKARASGVHLILATQRPSVDVITGTIKVNLPSRIALAVSSAVDSKTILDQSGAEMLLGRGDLLYAPIDAADPKRIQGAYVTKEEVEAIVEFVNENNPEDFYDDAEERIMRDKDEAAADDDGEDEADESGYDALLEDVARKVIETNQASTSMMQRRFKLGYARASRIIDQMERLGFIGSMDINRPTKPREVYLTREMFKEFFGREY